MPEEQLAVSTPQGEASLPDPQDPPPDSDYSDVKIANIQPGHSVSGTFLARQVGRLTAKNGNDYLQTRLYDESGEWIIARWFSAPEGVFDSIADEMTVEIDGYCRNFQGQMVIHLDAISPAQMQWETLAIPPQSPHSKSASPTANVSEIKPGRSVSGTFRTLHVGRLAAKNGSDYLQTRLYDKSGEWVIARWFGAPEEVFDRIHDEMTVDVDGYCQNHQGQKVVLINSIQPANEQWQTTSVSPRDEQSEPVVIRTVVSSIEAGDTSSALFRRWRSSGARLRPETNICERFCKTTSATRLSVCYSMPPNRFSKRSSPA